MENNKEGFSVNKHQQAALYVRWIEEKLKDNSFSLRLLKYIRREIKMSPGYAYSSSKITMSKPEKYIQLASYIG